MKGVPFDVINCDLQKKPKFLTDANPNGQVPVLLHDGNVVHESEVTVGEFCNKGRGGGGGGGPFRSSRCFFLEYVDAAFPDGVKLYPADPFERAKVRMTIIDFSNKVREGEVSDWLTNYSNCACLQNLRSYILIYP